MTHITPHELLQMLQLSVRRVAATYGLLLAAAKSETPGAATPGASMPSPMEEFRTMQTVPHTPAPSAPQPLPEIGSAQHAALLRWHASRPVGDVMDALQAHPHYPAIDGQLGVH